MIKPKTIEIITDGSTCFFTDKAAEVSSGSEGVERATVGFLLVNVNSVVVMIVVGSIVVIVLVTVVGTAVAKSCCTVVVVTSTLVSVTVSVTDTVVDVVTEDGLNIPLGAESALGAGVSFVAPVVLGVGRFSSNLLTLGAGRSFSIPGRLEVGTSFPTAGTLGADWSFPFPLSFSFLGDRTDPKESKIDLGKIFMSSNL